MRVGPGLRAHSAGIIRPHEAEAGNYIRPVKHPRGAEFLPVGLQRHEDILVGQVRGEGERESQPRRVVGRTQQPDRRPVERARDAVFQVLPGTRHGIHIAHVRVALREAVVQEAQQFAKLFQEILRADLPAPQRVRRVHVGARCPPDALVDAPGRQ